MIRELKAAKIKLSEQCKELESALEVSKQQEENAKRGCDSQVAALNEKLLKVERDFIRMMSIANPVTSSLSNATSSSTVVDITTNVKVEECTK